jgi:putative transposase
MPWKASSVMEERMRFMAEWWQGTKSRKSLCEEYGISRKTAYAMVARFQRDGPQALEERPRRAAACPHRTAPAVEDRVAALRLAHPTWGPKKLAVLLGREGTPVPARSTIALILKRKGLSRPQRRRRHGVPASPPLVEPTEPNVVWSTDFKGHFHVGTGERCDPLTAMDLFSRCLLACHGYFSGPGKVRQEEVIEVFRELFRLHGLPRYIVSDNGGPFASSGPGGLTLLSVFWIRLGITPLRIAPGKPQQNGRLERMHRTLKAEAARPPQRTVGDQVRRLEEFRREYNEVRPHEALAMATPESAYRSGVPWNGLVPEPVFAPGAVARRVSASGGMKWRGRLYAMPSGLAGQDVGVVPVEAGDERVLVYLGTYCVGILELGGGRILAAPRDNQLLALGRGEATPEAVREVTA